MNIIDKKFKQLVTDIKGLGPYELYYKIRRGFDNIPDETKESCTDFFNQFGYWGLIDTQNNNYEEIEKKTETFLHHMDDFVWLYDHLCDYRSRKTLYSILNNWYQYDFITATETQERMFEDYFDLDLVKCNKDEVVVDLGAYTGDTVLSYIQNYGEDCYKKIYCYEITPSTFKTLQENVKKYKNIECRLKGVGDQKGKMKLVDHKPDFSANTLSSDEAGNVIMTTLDADIEEKITLIKADIEGFEQKAILGSKKHIEKEHPKLLISVYHNNEDLWKIPKMIHEIYPGYQFYLRYHGSPIYPTEITLIAIAPANT